MQITDDSTTATDLIFTKTFLAKLNRTCKIVPKFFSSLSSLYLSGQEHINDSSRPECATHVVLK